MVSMCPIGSRASPAGLEQRRSPVAVEVLLAVWAVFFLLLLPGARALAARALWALRDWWVNRRCPPCGGHRWIKVTGHGYGPGWVFQCAWCGRIRRVWKRIERR